ncbi:MAG: hypothetical protein ACI4Q3_09950 [Kiritimatiellia bacterium]
MKKSMFALACAASIAVSADVVNGIGFEDYSLVDGLFSGISGKDDAGLGSGSLYWLYEASSGSEDGSAVKAFETAPTYSGVDFGKQYLELSTEGGTLWRSINTLGGDSEMALGTAYTVPDAGLYIDTMVQFTPTEDGGDPDLVEADKLAIWVDVTDDVTNLYVRAELIEDAATFSPNTFVLVPADGTTLAIDPSAWYRLTVKAETIALSEEANFRIGAFQIFIDGQQMMAKVSPFGEGIPEMLADYITTECADLMAKQCLIPSLEGIVDFNNSFTLTAVGFKGSGAIDNLSIGPDNPIAGGTLDWENPKVDTGTAEAMFGITGDLADVDGQKLAAWATANDIAFANASDIQLNAFLLNCANTDEAIKAANEAFKITSISFDDAGKVVVETTSGPEGEKTWNGTVEIRGSQTVDGTYTKDNESARFFKAFLIK